MTGDQNILDATKKGELVQFDLTNMKDQISDQMRAFLLNMMPKEAFNQVIETAWKKLTEPKPEVRNSYGSNRDAQPSELEQMITVEMKSQLKLRVEAWGKEWGSGKECSLGAKAMFNEMVEVASAGFIHRVGVAIVRDAASALASHATASVPCSSGVCCNSVIPGTMCGCGTWN